MDFLALAAECAPLVPLEAISAVIQTESSFNPLVINVNGQNKLMRQPSNDREAIVTAMWLIDHGYSVDLGLAQINSKNLNAVGLSVAEAFDPCKNLAAGAKILQANFWRAKGTGQEDGPAMLSAYSAYNTGSLTYGFQNGYVQGVESNAGATSDQVFPIPLKNSVSQRDTDTAIPQQKRQRENSRASRIVATGTRSSRLFDRAKPVSSEETALVQSDARVP